ncbi:MAG: class I SAM-dependent methyltransferase [Proteobacteria bacterium]|nr:class I SAM-dependent methyltransferase [Bacteroidota bacterium]MBU1713413.1 class I SAM-dependent methyltransferase [Pseudomonadota bacterium]
MAFPEKCPLCGEESEKHKVVTRHVYGDKDHSRAFYHCPECDVRYLHPTLTPEEEAQFYASEFGGFMAARTGVSGGWEGAESHVRANESARIRRSKYLSSHILKGASILEVGCSSGFMLFPLIDEGHACTGIEPSGMFCEYLRNRRLVVYPSLEDFKENEPDRKFDIILHFFVLEHITTPLAFLESQIDLLNDGGKIIFEIPNVADPLYSIYDIPEFERFYWSIAHPWYFSEASLKYLLDRLCMPYEILLDQRYDLSNHMTWARDGKPGGMGRYTEMLGSSIEEMYKQALIKNRRCDTLIAVISKGKESNR